MLRDMRCPPVNSPPFDILPTNWLVGCKFPVRYELLLTACFLNSYNDAREFSCSVLLDVHGVCVCLSFLLLVFAPGFKVIFYRLTLFLLFLLA